MNEWKTQANYSTQTQPTSIDMLWEQGRVSSRIWVLSQLINIGHFNLNKIGKKTPCGGALRAVYFIHGAMFQNFREPLARNFQISKFLASLCCAISNFQICCRAFGTPLSNFPNFCRSFIVSFSTFKLFPHLQCAIFNFQKCPRTFAAQFPTCHNFC